MKGLLEANRADMVSGDATVEFENVDPNFLFNFPSANHTLKASWVVGMNQTYKVGPVVEHQGAGIFVYLCYDNESNNCVPAEASSGGGGVFRRFQDHAQQE
jgi:hypothetical protein